MKFRTLLFGFLIISLFIFVMADSGQPHSFATTRNAIQSSVDSSTNVDWWPMFCHDPSHSGFSTSDAPNNNDTLWIYDTRHQIASSPVILNDILLIGPGTSDNYLYALNATTGLLLWKYEVDGASSPCADNGKVIFESWSGLHAFDIITGKSIWNTSYNGWLRYPVVTDGRVFAVGQNSVFAFSENDGKEIWSFASTSDFSSPVIADNVVFVGSYGVYALDVTSGQQKWHYVTNDRTSALTVADSKVFVVSMGPGGSADTASKFLALDANSGNFLWSFNANPHGRTDAEFASSAFHNGKVFVSSSMSIDNYGSLFAFEANTGALLWKSSVGGYHSAPAIADGRIYLMSYGGQMQSFSESNGDLVWSYTTTGGSASHSSPAVAAGRVYVGSGNGKIYCFGPMLYFNITLAPEFYDNRGEPLVPSPSSWTIIFPNGTRETVSNVRTFNGPMGTYSINSIVWKGLALSWSPPTYPHITPASFFLASDTTWSPRINCTLPTSLSLSLSSSTSYIGFRVAIDGSLTCNDIGVPDAAILLSYSVTAGESWNDISLVDTTSEGQYSVVWMPQATGNYLVKAAWAGNATYPESTKIINLAVTSSGEENVFAVESNSTISALAFNSTSLELSFTVSGETGTIGYVKVTIAKSLISNIADVKVYLDGNQTEYSATSQDDAWILTFTYTHSTHNVTIDLKTATVNGRPSPLIYFIAAAIIITVISGIIIIKRSKQKPA